MNEIPDSVQKSVGTAVLASQNFEHQLVNAYYHLKIVTEGYEISNDKISSGAIYKIPIRNLVKSLVERTQIEPQLANRIAELLEKRHTIVHRWLLSTGGLFQTTDAQWDALRELSEEVARESLELSLMLAMKLARYLEIQLNGGQERQLKDYTAGFFMDSTPLYR